MFRKSITAVALTAVIAATSLSVSSNEAAAGKWHKGFAAGVAGGLAVGIVGLALTQRQHAPVYYYGAPPVGSPAWYQYCAAKYKSFNPNTGMYLSYNHGWQYCR